MADDNTPQEMPSPPTTDNGILNFFLGQLNEKVSNTARDVANLIGPRMAGFERRLERLEGWRNWLTGAVAAMSFLILSLQLWTLFRG